ncbi:MAG: thioredoxin family protein [Gammaproteobacteria bacterium]
MAIRVLDSNTFDEAIHSHELVAVDFWAKWCGPCVAFGPVFEQVSEAFPDVLFAKVDIEECPDLAADFNIRSVPMLMIFKQDIAVFAESGAHTAHTLSELISSAKALDISQVLDEIKKITEAKK